jgi:hypothetical protein
MKNLREPLRRLLLETTAPKARIYCVNTGTFVGLLSFVARKLLIPILAWGNFVSA